jgi:hypothetical protein
MESLGISEKKCTKCGLVLPIDGFYKNKSEKSGTDAWCKNCAKAHYYANKEKINERMKTYRQANKEKISEHMKAYRQANKEKISERKKAYRQANREKRNEYDKKRKKTDICYAIKYRLRDRIRTAVKAQFTEKASKTKELLGCDYATFKRHFEKQFTAGMTWDLFMEGKIHIDHIVPCANFDLKDEQQQRACFHYKNLQPLWAADNLAKQDKILEPVQMVLGV